MTVTQKYSVTKKTLVCDITANINNIKAQQVTPYKLDLLKSKMLLHLQYILSISHSCWASDSVTSTSTNRRHSISITTTTKLNH